MSPNAGSEKLFGKFGLVVVLIARGWGSVVAESQFVQSDPAALAQSWRTTHGDMSHEEWALIAELVAPYWSPGKMGRPVTVQRRRVLDASFYVAATGCQWRALPDRCPNWNTVHRYHLTWSRDGTWEAVAARLAAALRSAEGRDPEPSAGSSTLAACEAQ